MGSKLLPDITKVGVTFDGLQCDSTLGTSPEVSDGDTSLRFGGQFEQRRPTPETGQKKPLAPRVVQLNNLFFCD